MPKALQIFVYCLLLVFAFSLPASVSYAKIYTWKDEQGKTHFTDDPSRIPSRYRKGEKDGLRTIKEAPPQVSSEPHSETKLPVTRSGFPQEHRVPLVPTESGNFIVDTTLNGKVKVKLMLDTGASLISLTPEVSEKLGRTSSPDSAKIPFQTANGVVWNELLALDKVKIGDVEVDTVEASIGEEMSDLDGLLGMSFFSNFHMEINRAKSELILKPLAEPGEQVWDGKPALWWKTKFQRYNTMIEEYKIQAAQAVAFGDPMGQTMTNVVLFYENLRKNLALRASLFGVPKNFNVSK